MNFTNVDEYISHFSSLVEMERREEMRRHWEEIKRISGKRRERLGRAILHLRGKFVGRGLGGVYLYKFSRKDMPETEISVGDVVIVSRGKVTPRNPQATVYEKGKRYIVLAFQKKPPEWVKRDVRVDLYANDITFQRMLEALKSLRQGKYSRLVELLLLRGEPENGILRVENFMNRRLNRFQREAVERILGSEVFLVHGPPGTGKTTTLVEAIVQMVNRGYKILATADSNVAVDNLVEKLARKVKVVRVGHPARVSRGIMEHTLDYIAREDPEYRKAMKLWDEIEALREEQARYRKPTPQWRRGMGDDEIIYMANSSKSFRGVPSTVIKEMAQWIKIQRRIEDMVRRARGMEERALKRIIEGADVVCTTNSTAGNEIMRNARFDAVFIDEATQAVEPSCLIPMLKGERIFMAGDHKQLPPTVMSYQAEELKLTLFERWIESFDSKITLRVQYRMNEKIMKFPSEKFYNGLLEAHSSVRGHTIQDLGVDVSKAEIPEVCLPENVVVFVDTGGNCREEQRTGSTSYQNPCEATLVERYLSCLLDMGLKEKHIGVITPYDDQVELLKSMLPEGVEVKSVDGFQGREKEVIIISFVRSNPSGGIGFLWDPRRLNVAITRAKRKLIMVGDSSTLGTNQLYRELIEYVSREGKVLALGRDV